MNPFEESSDNEFESASNSEQDTATVIMTEPPPPYQEDDKEDDSDSDESELRRLQEQYNEEEEEKEPEPKEPKELPLEANPDEMEIQTSIQAQPSDDVTYQKPVSSPFAESEPCSINAYSPQVPVNHTGIIDDHSPFPSFSGTPTQIDHIHNDKKQEFAPYVVATSTVTNTNKKIESVHVMAPKTSPLPPKTSPLPPKTKQINSSPSSPKNMTSVQVKFVNFVARVKSHQTKKIWQTYNYNTKGCAQNANNILAKLKSIDKNKENGSFIIDDKL
eukprot:487118_1